MASASNPPVLSFPRQTFAKLSPAPFLHAHLKPTTKGAPISRPNGRAPNSFRTATAHTSSLSHASGSAVVRTGDTACVCGVRGEILLARDVPGQRFEGGNGLRGPTTGADEIAELGLVVPNIELSTGCSPAHIPGQPPSTLAQSLSQRILKLLQSSKLIDPADLRIWHDPRAILQAMDTEDGDEDAQPEVKAFWVLYIDILFISLDGNPFDVAWAAVLASLSDTHLPRAHWDIDNEMVVCSPSKDFAHKLRLDGFPLPASFAVFSTGRGASKEAWVLADPDDFEEGLCTEEISLVVDCSGKETRILRIEKSGGGAVGIEEIRALVALAEGRWQEWKDIIHKASSSL
ncbi:exoribonuclease family protein [Xylona heveae TC161]|uniref:Ribosomal RNA-processing protein 43 n=1 Tax=Xylona heveae (strain CBS 132557 / TC161) TaxID=1328760 RepID=A0A165FFF2_XYLHT|nr:exoribonuclease family protein [Xylona heveae TC161]KZF20914.1 exoribonuclease family protein [Xylona heveae TC161]